ncbi:MAG: hypothetical protein J6M30_06340 [Bacteroidales bacterium]|nr:hypothetical protein [Bacteroidales bacterium]
MQTSALNINFNLPVQDLSFFDKIALERGWVVNSQRNVTEQRQDKSQISDEILSLAGILAMNEDFDWQEEKEEYLKSKYLSL